MVCPVLNSLFSSLVRLSVRLMSPDNILMVIGNSFAGFIDNAMHCGLTIVFLKQTAGSPILNELFSKD
jgi:ABC-type enterochelin transport system permease subunit